MTKFYQRRDISLESVNFYPERLNSKYVNSSFCNELCGLNILHMRAPGDGGRIEKTKSNRFEQYADKIRFSFPNTAEIFDNIGEYYNSQALCQDTEAKKERLLDL